MAPFTRLSAHFGHGLAASRRGRKVFHWRVAAGLISGQGKKSCRRRKLVRVTHVMRLLTEAARKASRPRMGLSGRLNSAFIERAPLTVRNARLSSGSSHVGDVQACLTLARPSGVVASVPPCCASSPIAESSARAATRARWHSSGATRPPTDGSSGSRQNDPRMDGARGALLPRAFAFRLRGIQARWGCRIMSREAAACASSRTGMGASLWEEKACPDGPMTHIQPEVG
jgi:hypothetical protein